MLIIAFGIPLMLVIVGVPFLYMMIVTYFDYYKSIKKVHPAFREQAKAMWRARFWFLPDITIKD